MKKLALSVIATVLMVLGLGSIASMSPAYATVICANGTPVEDYSKCEEWSSNKGSQIAKNHDLMGILNVVINVIVGVVGFIAVVMIIIGGIGFVTSQGDAAKTTKARNTVLYGVVGLVVALLAFAIVNFVLNNVFK